MPLIKTTKDLWISFSAFEDYHKCPRLYYWKRIRKLEKIMFFLPFFIGRIIGSGIHAIYTEPKKALTIFEKAHKEELAETRKKVPLSAAHEEEITMQEYIGKGMMDAYKSRYSKLIAETKIIRNEVPFHYKGIKGVVVVGKLDNVMRHRESNYVHELKTTAHLTTEYITGIKTRMQPAMYKYMVNRMKDATAALGGRLKGVIFDVIRKPSIHLKKKETKQEYMQRLLEWYKDGSENKFHLERDHDLILKEEAVMNTVERTTSLIKQFGMEKEAYYQNFAYCSPTKGFKCDMYDLCHSKGQDKDPVVMVQYRKKESYHVDTK